MRRSSRKSNTRSSRQGFYNLTRFRSSRKSCRRRRKFRNKARFTNREMYSRFVIRSCPLRYAPPRTRRRDRSSLACSHRFARRRYPVGKTDSSDAPIQSSSVPSAPLSPGARRFPERERAALRSSDRRSAQTSRCSACIRARSKPAYRPTSPIASASTPTSSPASPRTTSRIPARTSCPPRRPSSPPQSDTPRVPACVPASLAPSP
mmetsp:Transcript_4656/g.17796  ORF Transcript_4656/g.17796 Transcript_4656/m.17796 type:complete len:206 (-) Transcript_4656:398-1015(-)